MADIQGVCFEPTLGILICKLHGSGVRPEKEAIKRHLRGERHFCKGKILQEAVEALAQLPLTPRRDLHSSHPTTSQQPVPSVPYLTLWPGWDCRMCSGEDLTTSRELRDRHIAKVYSLRPSRHSEENPLWESCTLQTFFSMTGDRRYFRVLPPTNTLAGVDIPHLEEESLNQFSRDDPDSTQEASNFLKQLRDQRQKHISIATAGANVNPDPTTKGAGVELWMKKLGIDRYIAGIHKDEMAISYKPSDSDDSVALQDLRKVSTQLLTETWQWCQYGTRQRLTDPQAARISSFWHAADPEGKSRNFRRAVQSETLYIYLNHWAQMLTFC
jgi:hypothetical protein